MSHRDPVYRSRAARRSSAPIWAAVIITLGMAGAAVLLTRSGMATEGIAGLLAAIGTAAAAAQIILIKLAGIEDRQRDIAGQTEVIERRTNGELADTIHAAINQALQQQRRPSPRPGPEPGTTPAD